MKKLTVVGKGAVGSIAVAHFLEFTDWKIDWIFDTRTPTASVGEATNLLVPRNLYDTLNFNNDDLLKMNGTPKLGINKKGWSKKEFLHPFPSGLSAVHFEAKELQNYIYDKVKDNNRITIIDSYVKNPEDLDSDYVLVCSGSPKEIDNKEFIELDKIPVNSVYVTQCKWDYPKFSYSLTDAMKYGWVFGIPLQNRISIGYMYNDKINSLEQIKEDVKQVFNDYQLNPSDKTLHLEFNSYYRKNNFSEKVIYNGNASFFLEPLEATSTGFSVNVNKMAFDLWHGNLTKEECQAEYERQIHNIESMILLHYMSGSVHNTEFWKKAKKQATQRMETEFKNKSEWASFVLDSVTGFYNRHNQIELGTWEQWNYQMNIEGLELTKKIKKLGGLL